MNNTRSLEPCYQLKQKIMNQSKLALNKFRSINEYEKATCQGSRLAGIMHVCVCSKYYLPDNHYLLWYFHHQFIMPLGLPKRKWCSRENVFLSNFLLALVKLNDKLSRLLNFYYKTPKKNCLGVFIKQYLLAKNIICKWCFLCKSIFECPRN